MAKFHPSAPAGRTKTLSLTALTPGTTSTATRSACFSVGESTIPHKSTVPSATVTLIKLGLTQGSAFRREASFSRSSVSAIVWGSSDLLRQARRRSLNALGRPNDSFTCQNAGSWTVPLAQPLPKARHEMGRTSVARLLKFMSGQPPSVH